MRGQDPLDERRTGARQTDDEDRLAARATDGRRRASLRVEHALERGEQRFVVGDRVVQRAPLAGLASRQVRERTRVLAEILELLRERMPHVQLAVDVVSHTVEQRFEPSDVIVRRGLLAQIGKRGMRAIKARSESHNRLELALRLVESPDNSQRGGEVVVEIGGARSLRYGTLEHRDCARVIAEARPDYRERVERQSVAGCQSFGTLGGRACFVVAVQEREAARVLCVIVRPCGLVGQRTFDRGARLGVAPPRSRHHTEQEMCVGVLRSARKHFKTRGVRAGQVGTIQPLLSFAMPASDFPDRSVDRPTRL